MFHEASSLWPLGAIVSEHGELPKHCCSSRESEKGSARQTRHMRLVAVFAGLHTHLACVVGTLGN